MKEMIKNIVGFLLIIKIFDWITTGFSDQLAYAFGQWSFPAFIIIVGATIYCLHGKI